LLLTSGHVLRGAEVVRHLMMWSIDGMVEMLGVMELVLNRQLLNCFVGSIWLYCQGKSRSGVPERLTKVC